MYIEEGLVNEHACIWIEIQHAHYNNMPMQYTAIFNNCKHDNF